MLPGCHPLDNILSGRYLLLFPNGWLAGWLAIYILAQEQRCFTIVTFPSLRLTNELKLWITFHHDLQGCISTHFSHILLIPTTLSCISLRELNMLHIIIIHTYIHTYIHTTLFYLATEDNLKSRWIPAKQYEQTSMNTIHILHKINKLSLTNSYACTLYYATHTSWCFLMHYMSISYKYYVKKKITMCSWFSGESAVVMVVV